MLQHIKRTTPFLKAKLCRLVFVLLFQCSAHAQAVASKNLIIFVQGELKCNVSLKEAFEAQGHRVSIVFLNDSTHVDAQKSTISFDRKTHRIKDFDLVYFRTWGDEQARHLAHMWHFIFEKNGVPCLETLQAKLYPHSKYTMMKLFMANDLPIPNTVIVPVGTSIDACIETIKKNFSEMVVIKGEGSGGKDISFVPIGEDAKLRKVLLQEYLVGEKVYPTPLVLQQYVKSKDRDSFSYHYRILVLGGKEIIATSRFQASSKTQHASNLALGGTSAMVSTDSVFSAEQQKEILRACKLTTTEIAGVDATVVDGKLYIFEVNNSPSLAPYKKALIQRLAAYSIQHLARQ